MAHDDGRTRAGERAWADLAKSFTSEFDEMTDAISHRLVEELPSFGYVPHAEMVEIAREGMGALITPVRERRPLTRREFEVYRATTEAQAVQGVLLDDMLQAWHVGFDSLRTWGREKTSNHGAGSANVLLDFLDIVIPWYDGGMATSVDWYRAAANRAFLANTAERAAFVRRAVGGGLEPAELATRSRLFGLSPTATYRALRAPAATDAAAVEVVAWLGLSEGTRQPTGMVALVDGDVWGFVQDLPAEPIGVPVGVSGPCLLGGLPAAFRLATRAMDTAAALGLTGPQDVRSLGIHMAVVDDHAVGASLLCHYVEPLEGLGQAGVEILNTVRAFLDNQGHHERTAAQLYVHPNTVRYRIKRYEDIVGTSLRDTATMVGIWWALERRRVDRL